MKKRTKQKKQLEVAEARKIPLPQGGTMDIEMSQPFIVALKKHFGVPSDKPLDDDQVRMYVYGAVNTAVTRAERDAEDGNKPAKRARRAPRRKARKGS